METLTIGPLGTVRLTSLMDRTVGRPEMAICMIAGPTFLGHPDLAVDRIREVPGRLWGTCFRTDSAACMHGTFVARVLCARRGSKAFAFCPGCTVLVRPIYSRRNPAASSMPSPTTETPTEAIVDCVNSGARILNLSSVHSKTPWKRTRILGQSLDYAASRGVITAAVADNKGLARNPLYYRTSGRDSCDGLPSTGVGLSQTRIKGAPSADEA